MESRKSSRKERGKRKNKKRVRRKSALSDNVYYHTDDEEYVWKKHVIHRSTSFPLFRNQSDDEFIQSKAKETSYQKLMVNKAEACGQYDNVLLDPKKSVHCEDYFPFELLPVDCKLKIFSFLDNLQKGVLLSVSKFWYRLLQQPSLWNHLSIWNFPMQCLTSQNNHESKDTCYVCYKKRVQLFVSFFILWIKPRPKRFEFKFNIAECSSGYLNLIQTLIKILNFRELKVASLNWKETPCRPYWIPPDDTESQDVMYRHRLRARYFVGFFDRFTKKAPSVQTLIMPFDWSDKSISCLLRLKDIHTLVLEKYYVFQTLDQDLLTQLLNGLPNLRKFMLEVWTPSGPGLVLFSVSSTSLEYFDVSQSRGFYLKHIDMPKLEKFRIMRHPWNGPLVTSDRINMPCLYNVLVKGAPNLSKLNDHYLEREWKEICYPTLDEVLRTVCSCRRHKTGWAM